MHVQVNKSRAFYRALSGTFDCRTTRARIRSLSRAAFCNHLAGPTLS